MVTLKQLLAEYDIDNEYMLTNDILRAVRRWLLDKRRGVSVEEDCFEDILWFIDNVLLAELSDGQKPTY